MAQITLKGKLKEIGKIETSKEDKKYQKLLIQVAGAKDEFGEPKSDDEIFEVMIYGEDRIHKTWKDYDPASASDRIEVSCWLNSRPRLAESLTFYNLSLTLKAVKFH